MFVGLGDGILINSNPFGVFPTALISPVFLRFSLKLAIFQKMRKWPYLSPGASNPKNKGTFFSSTFKVEEKKVPLFFGFGTSGLRYGSFLIFLKNDQPVMSVEISKLLF